MDDHSEYGESPDAARIVQGSATPDSATWPMVRHRTAWPEGKEPVQGAMRNALRWPSAKVRSDVGEISRKRSSTLFSRRLSWPAITMSDEALREQLAVFLHDRYPRTSGSGIPRGQGTD